VPSPASQNRANGAGCGALAPLLFLSSRPSRGGGRPRPLSVGRCPGAGRWLLPWPGQINVSRRCHVLRLRSRQRRFESLCGTGGRGTANPAYAQFAGARDHAARPPMFSRSADPTGERFLCQRRWHRCAHDARRAGRSNGKTRGRLGQNTRG